MNNFRTSDSDLAAYIITLGYEPSYVEVTKDKKHGGRLKAFTHFDGVIEELIKIQHECKNKNINVNLKDLSIARQRINKIIKLEINRAISNFS